MLVVGLDRSSDVVAALRIPLAGIAALVAGPTLPSGTASDVIAAAERMRVVHSAVLVVWSDETADGLALHAVGTHRGEPIVRRWLLPPDEPDAARAAALDIAAIVDAIVEAASVRHDGSVLPPAPPRVASTGSAPVDAARWRVVADVAVGARGIPSTGAVQLLAVGHLGVRFETRRFAVGLLAGGSLGSRLRAEGVGGESVTVDERELRAGAEAELSIDGTFGVGARAEVVGRWLAAAGSVASGSGQIVLLSGCVATTVEGRARLADPLDVRLGVAAEWAPVAERFSVQGSPVLDLGHVRYVATVGLRLALP